jgi:hypothetical protein
MAKRSKNPDQGALFEFAPVGSKSRLPIVPYTPSKKESAMMVVQYKDGVDVSHWSVPQSSVDDHKVFMTNSSKQRGFEYIFKVMGWDDYWEKWHRGEFILGRV